MNETLLSLPSRRAVLRGFGAALALPWMESLARASAASRVPVAAPLRFAVLYVPNGVQMADWTPAKTGPLEELPWILAPMREHLASTTVLSGLAQTKARANGDGPGDHARAAAAFLTASQPKKTAGRDLRAGVSFDQELSQRFAAHTRFRSLELACEGGRQSGECDSGYSCVYSNNLSWRSESSPATPETDPRQVFDRLFLGGESAEAREARAKRDAGRASVLDFVREDAAAISQRLGASDKRKLDEYLVAVRELEQRIEFLSEGDADRPGLEQRPERPRDFESRLLAMAELLALAFQTDQTRVATWMFANEGSNRSYKHLEVRDGHHELSHHRKDADKQEKIRRINRFHVQILAHFVKRLAQVEEDGQPLLDRCAIFYGSGIADGNSHAHHDLPLLLVGGKALGLKGGNHQRFARETPAANLFLALGDRFGVSLDRFGDSTGRLEELA